MPTRAYTPGLFDRLPVGGGADGFLAGAASGAASRASIKIKK